MTKRLLMVGMMALGLNSVGCMGTKPEEAKTEQEDSEVCITIDQVPAAARATLEKEAEGGKLSEFEKSTDEGKTVYEADAAVEDKTYEIKVSEDGTLLKKKLEENEKDEKDEAKEHAEKK